MASCECGCGEDAGVYATTAKGHRKGQPRRYVNGHNWRGRLRRERIDESYYRVEDRGHETPCWIWTRTVSRKGYGRLWDTGRRVLGQAHRLMYEQEVGPIPEGLQIDHLCRQRACVNPAHLEPVTQETNQRRGANAKLTAANRAEADRDYANGVTKAALARRYGVSSQAMDWALRHHAVSLANSKAGLRNGYAGARDVPSSTNGA